MASHSHRRQVLLFLAAILLPCVALVALGLRLVVQERELASSRLEDERRRVTRQLQQDLSSQPERGVFASENPATAIDSYRQVLEDAENLPEPGILAQEIVEDLEAARERSRPVVDEFGA